MGHGMGILEILVIITLILIIGLFILFFFQKRLFHDQSSDLQVKLLELIQNSVQKNMADVREQISASLKQHAELLTKQVEQLTHQTDERLKEISGQVDKRLADGFEKTTATFTDILKRLTIIDEAQKKITDLSNNVVSLQEVLTDKHSRGVFGEVQLNALIRDKLPESHFSLQHTLSNGKRVDCMLFLPEPIGHFPVDAKFPLEAYRQLIDKKATLPERQQAEKQFKRDIQKHIQDISEKYIIPGETSDSAMMFVPSEAIFAEIHAHHTNLVELAHRKRVWITSPTTMMAVLTMIQAILRDAATREQVHIIQKHLIALGEDFGRFQKRMDNLAVHIDQANRDVKEVHTSSKKITGRFEKIEKVELTKEELGKLRKN